MNKPVYLGLSIPETSKIVMNKFWYDYVKPKYGKKQKYVAWIQTALLSTKNRRHLRIHFKRCWNKIYTSNHELDQLLHKGKIKKLLD